VNGSDWTCARCGMTVRFMPGALNLSEMPSSWDEVNGIAYCLSCRRKMAGEAKAAALRVEEESADLVRADAEGRVEFELSRDPDRCDTRIARACATNVIVVRQVRERLGVYPTRPV
jgi:ribosomal protein L37AE/L43A